MTKDLYYSRYSGVELAEILYKLMIRRGAPVPVAKALVEMTSGDNASARSKLAVAIQGQEYLLRNSNGAGAC